jgi:hypothetical protein
MLSSMASGRSRGNNGEKKSLWRCYSCSFAVRRSPFTVRRSPFACSVIAGRKTQIHSDLCVLRASVVNPPSGGLGFGVWSLAFAGCYYGWRLTTLAIKLMPTQKSIPNFESSAPLW